MTKKTSVFEGIKAGLEEALAIARGEAEPAHVFVPEPIDVRAVRARTGLSQKAFAVRYHIGLARLRDLEQGRTRPDSVVQAYLKVIERNPKAVDEALAA